MPKIEGVKAVKKAISQLVKRSKKGSGSVITGYTASYALHVHENPSMKLKGQPRPGGRGNYWGPNGTNKFLEKPARSMRKELGAAVVRAVKGGATLIQGIVIAALRLQRESQKMVPVDTGNLKASAFTRFGKKVGSETKKAG